MKEVVHVGSFKKDYKRVMKRGKDERKLIDILALLATGADIPDRCRPHKLSGDWAGHWELHIEPDWLLIYQETEDAVYLYRTGTHSDLFK